MLAPRKRRRMLALLTVVASIGATIVWIEIRSTIVAVAATEKLSDNHSKGPIGELMQCPLAFAGVHLMRDDPAEARIAYHFCKPVSADLNQCVLYDGTGADAKLIGVEYLVSDDIYRSMPDEEKKLWHDHKFEVDTKLLRSLMQTGEDEKKTLAHVRTMWGKVYHTWVDGKAYPRGPARLFWSVTGNKPFVLPTGTELPAELTQRVE